MVRPRAGLIVLMELPALWRSSCRHLLGAVLYPRANRLTIPLTVTSNVALVAAQIAARNCQGFLPRTLLQAGKTKEN